LQDVFIPVISFGKNSPFCFFVLNSQAT
jgi:hypothetical protein